MDQVRPGLPQRMDNVVDKPNLHTSQHHIYTDVINGPLGFLSDHLGLLNGGVVSVAHGGDVQTTLPLPVALLEELLHDALAPLPVNEGIYKKNPIYFLRCELFWNKVF